MLDPAEEFDLDSLLYDIVKFDPNKVVQQQQQKPAQQLPQDVVDGFSSVKSSQSELVGIHDADGGEAPPSDQQEEGRCCDIIFIIFGNTIMCYRKCGNYSDARPEKCFNDGIVVACVLCVCVCVRARAHMFVHTYPVV